MSSESTAPVGASAVRQAAVRVAVAGLVTTLGLSGFWTGSSLWLLERGELTHSRAVEILGWGGVFAIHFAVAGACGALSAVALERRRLFDTDSRFALAGMALLSGLMGGVLYLLVMWPLNGPEWESFRLTLMPALMGGGITLALARRRPWWVWVVLLTVPVGLMAGIEWVWG